ncbi:MAG: hypothetical protein QNJ69_04845 [Gammaproteobacteria bacterium]|nr:hypothetical protein [Gammaproteobacteria bacterium]
MDQNKLCEMIERLNETDEVDDLPVNLRQDERDILEQVSNYDLFLKKTEFSYYPINFTARLASEAFNIEVIQNLKRIPKQTEYYEALASPIRPFSSTRNILETLSTKFGEIPKDKWNFMLLYLGQFMYAETGYDTGTEERDNKILDMISWFQSNGADINYTGSRNSSESVLMLQSGVGHAKTVQKLLQMGADPNLKLSTGGTALLFCAGKVFSTKDYLHLNYKERLKSMRVLLEAGAMIVSGPKSSDDARYFARRNTEKEYDGSEAFRSEAIAMLSKYC